MENIHRKAKEDRVICTYVAALSVFCKTDWSSGTKDKWPFLQHCILYIFSHMETMGFRIMRDEDREKWHYWMIILITSG